MKKIQSISLSYQVSGSRIEIPLATQDDAIGTISMDTLATPEPAEVTLIASAAGVIAGQACLAPHLQYRFAVSPHALEEHRASAQLFYDAHCNAQQKPYVDVALSAEGSKEVHAVAQKKPLLPKKCILMWSGGKDGIAALLLLRRNGYEVVGAHVPSNFPVRQAELDAATTLAKKYNMPMHVVELQWDVIFNLTREYSTSYDIFPFKNSVPHGRDYLIACMLAPLARQEGAGYVCAAYDRGTWLGEKQVRQRTIVFDSQSLKANVLLDNLLNDATGLHFFSPTSCFYEYSIFRHLMLHEPDAWKHISSCYFDRWCGQCIKCLKYALMQATLGKDYIPFMKYPFSESSPMFNKVIDSVVSGEATANITYCVATLFWQGAFDFMPATKAKLMPHEQRFATECPGIIARFDAQHPIELAPEGFICHY